MTRLALAVLIVPAAVAVLAVIAVDVVLADFRREFDR